MHNDKKEKEVTRRWFYLSQNSLKKIKQIQKKYGLTRDAALARLIKTGK